MQWETFRMNIKYVALFVGLSFCMGSVSAGTVTIKSPPEGMILLKVNGQINHGDEDLVITSTENFDINVWPLIEVAGQQELLGVTSVTHQPRATGQAFSNQTHCSMRQEAYGYRVTIELGGSDSVFCRSGEYKVNNQRALDGISDVVVTYEKL
jgi:hypothetical protein